MENLNLSYGLSYGWPRRRPPGASSRGYGIAMQYHIRCHRSDLLQIGTQVFLGLSQPKGGASGFAKKIQNPLLKTYVFLLNYRTVGLLAGYQGRRVASGCLPPILNEITRIARSEAPLLR